MKKIMIFAILTLTITMLTSCNKVKVEPLEDPQVDLFDVIGIYKKDNEEVFIYKRSNIDNSTIYTTIGYTVGTVDNSCILGSFHKANYLLKYDGEYYDIVEANKLELYTCELLVDLSVIEIEDNN